MQALYARRESVLRLWRGLLCRSKHLEPYVVATTRPECRSRAYIMTANQQDTTCTERTSKVENHVLLYSFLVANQRHAKVGSPIPAIILYKSIGLSYLPSVWRAGNLMPSIQNFTHQRQCMQVCDHMPSTS
jgi:hypothetical protein